MKSIYMMDISTVGVLEHYILYANSTYVFKQFLYICHLCVLDHYWDF